MLSLDVRNMDKMDVRLEKSQCKGRKWRHRFFISPVVKVGSLFFS